MKDRKREIVFLNRAYNDLDIQLSLITAFAEDGRFTVRVIGYPSDGDMGSPQYHEAVPFLRDTYGIRFETVLDAAPAPAHLRFLYKAERFLFGVRKAMARLPVFCRMPVKAVHIGVLTVMRRMLRGPLPWLDRMTASWNPLFICMDEVLAQAGRSYMMDGPVRAMAARGVPVYVIKTGHDIYWDPAPNKNQAAKLKIQDVAYRKTPAKRFIVPSEVDQGSAARFMVDETIEVHGNLRMSPPWIERLHREILTPPYFDKDTFLRRLPDGKPRVCFMLSKLGYGIKLDEMKETIRMVASLPGVACAIKPHTRGMKFDFMDLAEVRNCAIVSDIPSPVLIEWADIVLFTGSSIAFHALILGKRAGFLQHCQYLETIFDDGKACDKFESVQQLRDFLESWRDQGVPPVDEVRQTTQKEWRVRYIYGGLQDGRTAEHYKDTILGDLRIDAKKAAA